MLPEEYTNKVITLNCAGYYRNSWSCFKKKPRIFVFTVHFILEPTGYGVPNSDHISIRVVCSLISHGVLDKEESESSCTDNSLNMALLLNVTSARRAKTEHKDRFWK